MIHVGVWSLSSPWCFKLSRYLHEATLIVIPPGNCLTGCSRSARWQCLDAGPKTGWQASGEGWCLIRGCNQSGTSWHSSCRPAKGFSWVFRCLQNGTVCIYMNMGQHVYTWNTASEREQFQVPAWCFLPVCLESCWSYQQFILGSKRRQSGIYRVNLSIAQLFEVYLLWTHAYTGTYSMSASPQYLSLAGHNRCWRPRVLYCSSPVSFLHHFYRSVLSQRCW